MKMYIFISHYKPLMWMNIFLLNIMMMMITLTSMHSNNKLKSHLNKYKPLMTNKKW